MLDSVSRNFMDDGVQVRVESLLLLRTYIIGHYNALVRTIDLVSHIIFVVCINFIHE